MDKFDYYQSLHPERGNKEPAKQWSEVFVEKAVSRSFEPGGRYAAVASVLDQKKPAERLLEVGCGLGERAAWMTRYSRQVDGCDISIHASLVREHELPLTFRQFDADAKWPVADQWYDVVVAMMVMEHVFDPFHFTRECSRVLRPDGFLFLNVPLISSFRRRFDVLLGRVPNTSSPDWFQDGAWDGGHLHYFNLPLLEKLLGQAGLEVTRKFAVGKLHGLKGLWPSMLCSEISLVAKHVR